MSSKSTKVKKLLWFHSQNPTGLCKLLHSSKKNSIAQRVAVARNHSFCATAPNAQGLCQTLSVLQIVRLFHSSTAMARKEKHSPSGVHDNIIAQQTDTEIGTCLWTWVKALLQSAGVLYGKRRRAVPVHGHRVNLQSCTQMPPRLLRRKWIPGEKQPELSSRSLVPGYFLSGLANYYSPCRNNCRTNPIWPSFFSFPFTSVQTVHNLLFCPVESRAWIDDLMNLNRAQQIIAVNLAPAN